MARKGKISELYDLGAIQKQQDTVVALLGDLVNTLGNIKPIAVKLEGTEKVKEVIDGIKSVNAATATIAETSGKAVNAMGQLVDMSKKAAGSYEQQANLITKFAGTLDQNIKLQTQYKIRLDEIGKSMKDLKKEYDNGMISQDHYKNSLEALTAQQLEFKTASSELAFTIKAQAKEAQAAEGSYDQLSQRLGLLRDAFRQLPEDEQNGDAGKALMAQIEPLGAKLKELDASMGNFQRNVGNYKGAFTESLQILQGALGDVKKKMDDMNASGNVNAEVMASLQKEYDLLDQVVNHQSEGFASMRQEIRANQQAIEQLISVYGADSDVVQQLIQQNAELRDSMADIVATQRTLGSDTFAFDAMLQGGQALVGMYSAAQGAMALFGDESEELQKTMVKLQAAMALVQGVQAAVNALQKESALIQGLNVVRTTIAAGAMKLYTFVTAGATAAARAFNAALLASGIGVVLLLITSAASAMGMFSDSTDEATKSQEDLNKELEETRKKLSEVADAAEKARNAQSGGVNELKRELQLMEAKGAKDQDIYKKKKELMDKELFDLQVRRATFEGDADKQAELDEKIKDKKNEMVALGLAFEKKASDESNKIGKDKANRAKELAEREFKAQFDKYKYYQQKQIDEAKAQSEMEGNPFATRLDFLKQAMDREAELINAQKNYEMKTLDQKHKQDLEKEGLTQKERNRLIAVAEDERALIITKANDDIIKLQTKFVADVIAIRKQITDAEKAQAEADGEAVQSSIDKKNQDKIDSLTKFHERELSDIETNTNNKLTALNKEYTEGKIDKQKYEDEKVRIETEALKRSLQAQLSYYNSLLPLYEGDAQKKADALKKISAIEKAMSDIGATETAKRTDKSKEGIEKLRDAYKQLANELETTVFSVLESGIERQKNQIQEQIDMIDTRKQKEIEAANASIANTQDRAAAIAIIEARAQAQKEQLEKRKRQLDEQKARYERAKAVVDIIQSTTVAIMKTLKDFPGPQGIALAAVIGAIGAAQLVRTLAQPIPKYAMGTEDHPGGYAVVGDGGKKEYVQTPSGDLYQTPSTSTLVDLPAHSKVFKDEQALMKAMHGQHITATMTMQDRRATEYYQFQNISRSIEKMEGSVVKAIKNIPQPRFDKRSGLRGYIHGNGSITDYV